ncbi:MAG: undecaprenyl-diphosphate phosphatase [Clostridia bacterium]|nr:undecaprenyl-diphosphate phosphatase [Clostridia bacterium]
MLLDCLIALLYGLVEGVTEWLPVSSTGHLILLDQVLSFSFLSDLPDEVATEYTALFEVVIQLAAMLAVALRFWKRLHPFASQKPDQRRETAALWRTLLLGCFPAALVGLGADLLLEHTTGKDLDSWLFRPSVVAVALILYGLLFLLPASNHPLADSLSCVSPQKAVGVGLFQCLALIPGTSRSGAILLGAGWLGLSRPVAADLAFLVGLPTIGGASLLSLVKWFSFVRAREVTLPLTAYGALLLASVAAFLVSLAVIGFLTDFVKHHSFAPFGVYRIALGLLILLQTAL